jgi:hypothetical protein
MTFIKKRESNPSYAISNFDPTEIRLTRLNIKY